jgi:multicomponent K+:H+ antiporter subunit G
MLEAALAILILTGAVFTFVGSLGLARLQDFYTRLHGPTKATTLGVGSLLVASMVHFSSRGDGLSLHEILVTLFLFITAPVSAHLLSKAALHLRLRSLAPVPPVVDEADAPSAVEGDEPAGTPGSGGSSIRGRDQSFDRGSTP